MTPLSHAFSIIFINYSFFKLVRYETTCAQIQHSAITNTLGFAKVVFGNKTNSSRIKEVERDMRD